MNKLLRMSVLVGILAIGSLAIQSVHAQENGETPLVAFDTEQAIFVIILGVGAGFLVAYQGYRATAKEWDTLKFFDGVIASVLGAIPLALAAALKITNPGIFDYVIIFFAALGIGVTIQASRKKTIPSNATVKPGD